MKLLRLIGSASVGVVVAIVLFYGALVGFVLVTRGIPLGSQPRDTTLAERGVLLTLAAAAAAAGGRAASSVYPAARGPTVAAVCVALGLGSVWGFSGSNGWPDWWGPALALTMSAGAWCGGTFHIHRLEGR